MIKSKCLPDGGFVAGDTDTNRTSYAYPTSPDATAAHRRPQYVAWKMMQRENSFISSDRENSFYGSNVADYDHRNWALLSG